MDLFFSIEKAKEPQFGLLGYSCILVFLTVLFWFTNLGFRSKRKLPPGPWRLPIIGNLHQLSELPHRTFQHLAEKHGPLMYLQLGHIPTLVISSPEAASDVLKAHDLAFCSRPTTTTLKTFSYGELDIAIAPYGEHWRQMRRLATLEIFNTKRVLSFRGIREGEVDVMTQTISRLSSQGQPVNLSEMFLCLSNNITCQEVFGSRFSDDGLCNRSKHHNIMTEMVELLGGFTVGDFFPWLEWLNNVTGLRAKLLGCFKGMDDFFESEIAEHTSPNRSRISEHEDFLDVLLKLRKDSSFGFPLTRNHVKALLMDMFFAGTDSSASTLEWIMSELIKNPRVMKKAQDEVRRVIGKKENVEESDLHQLEYLKLVISETLRLHPPAPLLTPRESMEERNIDGYDVPVKTRILVNAWAIGRDPKSWEEPEVFKPERFEGSPINYKGQHFQFIPFGSGRRICPGMQLGVLAVELALANILYHFDWKPPVGTSIADFDMTEKFGIVIHKKSPLLLVATPAS